MSLITGLEPTEVSSKNLATRVSQVLINFKNKIEKATQVEKCLLFEKTISRINFSKSSLEVTVSLIDTTFPLAEGQNNSLVGRMAVRTREGAVNPDAPACSTSSILLIGSPYWLEERTFTFIVYFETKPAKPEKVERNYRNPLTLAIEYSRRIETGEAKNQTDLARKLGVSRVHVNHYIRLLDLDPEVVEAIKNLGESLPKPIITEHKLRTLVNLPRQKQKTAIRSLIPSR